MAFVTRIQDLQQRFEQGQITVAAQLSTVLRDWLGLDGAALDALQAAAVDSQRDLFNSAGHMLIVSGSGVLAGIAWIKGRLVTARDVKAALEARDRARCGPVAPSAGLYLSGVRYD